MQTITELRATFWDEHPQFKAEKRVKHRQNDYRTDIRCAFVDFVDSLARRDIISEKLAAKATL